MGDIANWPNLVAILRAHKGPAGRVWDRLGEKTRELIEDNAVLNKIADPSSSAASKLRWLVRSDLDKLLARPDFYSEEAFKGVPLGKDLRDALALGKKRTSLQTARMNWALLDATFPGCIPKIPDRFRTVHVQVLAGSDVVLVLSSYQDCRWEVTLRDGAKVTGVVLCGYHAQEVVGLGNVPVVYRAYYEPDGVTRATGHKYFYGYEEGKEQFKEFLTAVKSLTGKDFTTIKCEGFPDPFGESYTIRPVGK